VSSDYISFDEALSELNLRSAELKRLMSEGQIRGIRDGAGVKFRREDVDGLRRRQGAESPEELLFVDEDVEEGMATAQISEEDTLLEEEPEAVAEEIDLAASKGRSSGTRRTPRARSSASVSSLRNRAVAPADGAVESTLDRVLLIFTAVVMVYGVIALLAAAIAQKDGLTSFLADRFK